MLNIFCVDLDLPVTIDLYDFNRILHTDFDPTIGHHFHLAVDKNLNEFLKKYKLEIGHSELFYTPPNTTSEIHIDQDTTSKCKINYTFCANGSKMQWFKIKDSATAPLFNKTEVDTVSLCYKNDQCDLIYSSEVKKPSMVEVGTAHNIVNNTNEPRWCLSYMLWDSDRNVLPTWTEASKKLRNFIVDKDMPRRLQ